VLRAQSRRRSARRVQGASEPWAFRLLCDSRY